MYTSRIVAVGSVGNNILASFTLASKSIPYRELRVNFVKKKVNVYPRVGYESHPTNQDPEVDNYACIRAGQLRSGDWYAVSFNGHMCKRTEANLKDGLNPIMALDQTLLEFRGLKNDARIGAVGIQSPDGRNKIYLGTNDTDRGEKRICAYPNERIKDISNKLLFIYDKNTDFENVFPLTNPPENPSDLAAFIHNNIIGKEISFGIATAVAVIGQGGVNLGVYNAPLNEDIVAAWKEKEKV